jgi:hypothetical protein
MRVVLVDKHNAQNSGVGHWRTKAFEYHECEVAQIDQIADRSCIVDKVSAFDPDFVIVYKGKGMSNEDMRILHEKYVMIYYYMDYRVKRIALDMANFDIVLCNTYNVARYLKGDLLFEGYDPDLCVSTRGVEKTIDVGFIGTPRSVRRPWLVHVDTVSTGVYGLAHSNLVGRTKINLNLDAGYGGFSDRVLKILGSSGFLLSQYSEELEHYFDIGNDLDIFRTVDEMRDKIDFYLSNPEERNRIAITGHKKAQNYTSLKYAEEILKRVKDEKK